MEHLGNTHCDMFTKGHLLLFLKQLWSGHGGVCHLFFRDEPRESGSLGDGPGPWGGRAEGKGAGLQAPQPKSLLQLAKAS